MAVGRTSEQRCGTRRGDDGQIRSEEKRMRANFRSDVKSASARRCEEGHNARR